MSQSRGEVPDRPQFKLGQAFDPARLHRICTPDGRESPKNHRAESLDGGAGSVYPCRYGEHNQRRAVKFLTMPKLDPNQTGRHATDFTATFSTERDVLSQLSHSHINIFHEDGVYTDERGNDWPYLITDWVDGPDLGPAVAEYSGDAIYAMLRDLIDAIAYLHRRGVYHCDIKLTNIKLRQVAGGQLPDIVLLDFGAAKVLTTSEPPNGQPSLEPSLFTPQGTRRFISTASITHPRYQNYLDNSYDTATLQEFVPRHELYTIGVLIERLTSPKEEWSLRIRDRLQRTLGHQGFLVLDEMIADLKLAPDGRGYSSVAKLVTDFDKLHGRYLFPAGVPELGLASELQFSVPTVTGRAVMTRRLGHLAGHRLVNRLNQVYQLESTYLTFPGATHSRYSHSVTTLHNTQAYLNYLLNDSRFRREAEPQDLEATLILALLHDIGHYQLSHMFEDLATEQGVGGALAALRFDIPTDDTLFSSVLGSATEDLRGGFGRRIHDEARLLHDQSAAVSGLGGYLTPWQILVNEFSAATAESVVHLHDIIYAQERPTTVTPAQQVMAAVLSSDIDADKTAYLIEDAERSGVPFGLAADLDGILPSLCMPTAEDLSANAKRPVIGIRRRGLQAAQSIAISRNQMVSQVYWHRNNRSMTAMVKFVAMRLFQESQLDMVDFVAKAMFGPRETCIEWLSCEFDKVRQQDEVNPLWGVLGSGRHIYRAVCEVRWPLVSQASTLNDRLLAMPYVSILETQDQLRRALEGRSGLPKQIANGEVLIDAPRKARESPPGDHGGRVFVYDRSQGGTRGRPIEEMSALYSDLKAQHKELNQICRVFLSPRLAHLIEGEHQGAEIAEFSAERLSAIVRL